MSALEKISLKLNNSKKISASYFGNYILIEYTMNFFNYTWSLEKYMNVIKPKFKVSF